jgi:hypothetical protein
MKVRLANKNALFFDPETKLRLSGGEVKEVENIGYLTRLWLNGGGILIEKDEVPSFLNKPVSEEVKIEAVTEPEPPPSADIAAIDVEIPAVEIVAEVTEEVKPSVVTRKVALFQLQDEIKKLLADKTKSELKQMAKERGLQVKGNTSSNTLAKNILIHDMGEK